MHGLCKHIRGVAPLWRWGGYSPSSPASYASGTVNTKVLKIVIYGCLCTCRFVDPVPFAHTNRSPTPPTASQKGWAMRRDFIKCTFFLQQVLSLIVAISNIQFLRPISDRHILTKKPYYCTFTSAIARKLSVRVDQYKICSVKIGQVFREIAQF